MTPFRKGSEDEPERVLDVTQFGHYGGGALRKLGAILAVLLVVILLFMAVVSVEAGHVAVVTLFGRVTGQVLGEGIHLLNPLAVASKLSVRTQTLKEAASVPSNEGLIITLDTSLQFHLSRERAAEVYQSIGPNYIEIFVEPHLRSAIRAVTAAHSANALYTGGREEVQQKIQDMLAKDLSGRGIVVEAVLLRDIQLPAMLKASIEQKQQAEQDSLRMSFILQKEKQEAERKRIEAQGIADFQRIVAQGISQQLLEWKGIEATEKLATSNNAKVVIIGSGKTGLPVILSGQ